jgi:hypothetical protein
MTMIHVPRPAKNSLNLNRPVSALILAQVEHVHTAEKRLPLRYRTDIYVNAIKTEGEAARYISQVTAAIHRAHDDAAKLRTKRVPIRKAAPAAVGEERPASKRTLKATAKKAAGRARPKKQVKKQTKKQSK